MAKQKEKIVGAEGDAIANIEKLKAAIEKQKEGATETQKQTLKQLRGIVAAAKFVRIANKRIPRTIKAIEGIAALGGNGYSNTEAQRTAIIAALNEAVKKVENALSGTKAATGGFSLPQT